MVTARFLYHYSINEQAYRRKARDTHPDKNKDVPPDEAAEAFRQVVHAFEILSDESSRKRYDQTGKTDSTGFGNNNQQHQQWTWNVRYNYRPRKLKDKFEVQQAQSRVLHVVSLAQLQTIMLSDDDNENDDLLERNLLICFTTHATEQHADDEMVFPYPFAHMSSQGIWWEDLLQTVRIKFHRSSELSRLFNVSADECNESPVFVFAKRGTPLTADTAPHLPRLRTRDRQAFDTWTWEQIQVEVEFVNEHDHTVEIYWVHGSRAHKKLDLPPGHSARHTTMLSHEWYVRDARVDAWRDSPGRHKLSNESSLGSWKILSDESPLRIVIEGGQCFDMSGHCRFWDMQDRSCTTNPGFMREQCQRTCGHCSSQQHDEF